MITVLNQNLMSGLTQSERLVAEYTVTGSAVTTITFEGLDLVGDGGYKVVCEIISSTTTDSSLSIFANNDTTNTNYTTRYIASDSSTLITGSSTETYIGKIGTPSGSVSFSVCDVSLVNGYMCANSIAQGLNTAQGRLLFVKHNVSQTNITRLDFTCATSSGIGVGSKISIYRKR